MKLWTIASVTLLAVAVVALDIKIPNQISDQHECVNSAEDMTYLRNLALDAIDHALKTHIEHLFEIWVRDKAEQPSRAVAGMKNALSAHNRARALIMKWNPPLCDDKGKKS